MIYEINPSYSYTTSESVNDSNGVLGKDEFLKMLMAQMKHQDPMNPMESSDFSAQLAQFSSVEQLTEISDNLDDYITTNMILSQSVNNTLAANVIGRNVKATGDQCYYDGETETTLHFNLGNVANDVTINIYDEDGNTVKTIHKSTMAAGDKEILWDGTDDNGNQVSSGAYTFDVSATGANGETVVTTTYVFGEVSGVQYDENGASLKVGALTVLFGDVLEIFKNDG